MGELDAGIEWIAPVIEDISNLVLAIDTALDLDRPVDALGILANGAWEIFYLQSGYVSRYYSWLDRALEDVTAQDPMVALGAIEGAGTDSGLDTNPGFSFDIEVGGNVTMGGSTADANLWTNNSIVNFRSFM